uniref:Rho guanine nucleotide exchange factor 18 n=1 Tax=Callorhinchus milii TaxID=7868 RepID=A0A4W3JVK9_CALMI
SQYNVVPSMRGDLESDAQEFKAESWSLTVDPTFCDKQEKDLIKRQDVIYELMQTEMHHIQILEIMSEIFRKGMKEDLQFDHSTIDRIFPCLDELLEIHKNFFFCLKERRRESFVEDSERNFFISRIGNILMQQFSDENANKMKQTYGDFCSHHNEAVSVFKELQQQNKKFQHFIRLLSVNNLLVRRLGVPECILLVTQRITKYPVLLERILQYTKEGTEEHKDVTKSLSLIKDIIAAVDTKVNKYEKEQKLLDILNKFENKTCAKLKNGHTFRKQDLLSGERELLHDGSVYWKTATGRLKGKDITGLLLTDVLIFLQDKDQKYTFAAVDQKPAVISLQKLIVREVANEERGMFLISASSAGPEMYEIHTNSKEDRNTWMRLIRLAVERYSNPYIVFIKRLHQQNIYSQFTLRYILCQDQQICTSLEEKLRIYGEMAEKNGCEEAAQDAHLLMKPETTELPQAGLLLNAAVKEGRNLFILLCYVSLTRSKKCDIQRLHCSFCLELAGANADPAFRTAHGSLLFQAVVSIQDSCIEVQRLILQERERPPHNHGPRGSLLLEQEKQRNLEKQREELVNVRKLQHQLQQEQQRWELECEWRQREQEAQANRLQERERECQQQAEQLRKEQEDLQSQWKEYQQNSERLREGMKLVEKNKERVQLQQSHQRNNNMRVFPEPPKVDGYLSSATRTDENQKHEVPVQLVSTTNQLLKPATVHQQIPARLASFSKTNREKNNKGKWKYPNPSKLHLIISRVQSFENNAFLPTSNDSGKQGASLQRVRIPFHSRY